MAQAIARALLRSRTMLWVCIGGAAQLVVVSALWSWLPSFLHRAHGVAPGAAGVKAALVVLAGAAGAVLWGAVVDRAGIAKPRRRFLAMALLCLASMVVLVLAFGLALAPAPQFALIAVGGFLATCTVGPVSAIVIDVVHPGVRATGSSVLALFQNLFGLAAGPFLAGMLYDLLLSLQHALMLIPLFSVLAALALLWATRSYETDLQRAREVADSAETVPDAAQQAYA